MANYIERLVTSLPDLVNLCIAAKLKDTVFTLDDGFRVSIWQNTEEIKRVNW
ncbi:MAG: hypothetical protein SGJ04_02200 [Bacteroidota bacterium]|nr:hypothetical protein [Bacteroidota bacterium]